MRKLLEIKVERASRSAVRGPAGPPPRSTIRPDAARSAGGTFSRLSADDFASAANDRSPVQAAGVAAAILRTNPIRAHRMRADMKWLQREAKRRGVRDPIALVPEYLRGGDK